MEIGLMVFSFDFSFVGAQDEHPAARNNRTKPTATIFPLVIFPLPDLFPPVPARMEVLPSLDHLPICRLSRDFIVPVKICRAILALTGKISAANVYLEMPEVRRSEGRRCSASGV